MSRIFAKSPYIIEINEASQIGAKVEIYLKNGVGSYPTSPSYTLSKLIASSNAPTCYFDISEYIQNFLNCMPPRKPGQQLIRLIKNFGRR